MMKTYVMLVFALFVVLPDMGDLTSDCGRTVLDECFLTNITSEETGPTVNCSTLQEYLDCLSIPRCLGTSLRAHRLRLLRTAMAVKRSSRCQTLEYSQLEKLIRRVQQSCNTRTDGGVVADTCGRRCWCFNGTITNCGRVRKEFTSMRFTERRRFIETFKKAGTHRLYRKEFERILNIHSSMDTDLLHHTPNIFLPWHRWYVLQLENLLQSLDCRVTAPYWDWSRNPRTWWKTSTRGVWCPGSHCLGGDGVVNANGCVQDGPFQKSLWSLTMSAGGGCLKRKFAKYVAFASHNAIKKILCMPLAEFGVFEWIVREKFHNDLHDGVAGTMANHATSSNAPELWLHHSFLDKLWYNWQLKGEAYKYHYQPWIPDKMPLTAHYTWQVLDSEKLPGGVRVIYDEPSYGNATRLRRTY